MNIFIIYIIYIYYIVYILYILHSIYTTYILYILKNFMASFYGWGSLPQGYRATRRRQFPFYHKSPEISGTHLIDLRRMISG